MDVWLEQPTDSVAVYTAEVGFDQDIGDQRGVVAGNVYTQERLGGELTQDVNGVGPSFGHAEPRRRAEGQLVKCFCSLASRAGLGRNPTMRSTGSPPLKRIRVGIPWMPS